LGKRLHTKGQHWQFDDYVSAAGWIDKDHFMIASSKSLFKFNLETAEQTHICDLESDLPANRSNDGRADPQGGFWIGTMGLNASALMVPSSISTATYGTRNGVSDASPFTTQAAQKSKPLTCLSPNPLAPHLAEHTTKPYS